MVLQNAQRSENVQVTEQEMPYIGSWSNWALAQGQVSCCSSEDDFYFKRKNFVLTTDAWTSIAKTGYVTCTVHFINRDTWVLHSMVLGLFEKTGWSRAIDCVEYAERQMVLYNLYYSCMTAVVTDTEATVIAAGRLLIDHSHTQNAGARWHGWVDQLLELVTGITFTDTPKSLGTMSASHSIVIPFNSSSQAMSKLLSKQVELWSL